MPPTRAPSQPWYTSVNIDLVVRLCKNTIFQPFICCLIPICLRATATPWSEPAMINSIAWAIFIIIVTMILGPLSDKMAYGALREVDQEEEVIVITGGASGLGRCLAEIWALKGAAVAVLDVKGVGAEAAVEGVSYYQCDITDQKQVEKCWEQINEELGLPTVLINNAGIVHGKRMLDASMEDIERTFSANTVAQYRLVKLFLPPLLKREGGGTLVTVSSVLGRLGASRLSDYTASKAALLAMHQSLSSELRPYPNIKIILVAPGQLSSEMFAGLEQKGTIRSFFGPVVEVSELAVKIIKKINEGEGGEIIEPAYARWISLMDLFPAGVRQFLRNLAGIDTAMDQFGGRLNNENGATHDVKRM